ncbi:unnamed protein product, partial [Polarella glacialis]
MAASASNGPVLFVKNTFLDLDDAPRLPVLARWKSLPAPSSALQHDSEESESEEGPSEADDAVACPGERASAAPPAMPELYRTVTCDGYEPSNEWSWVQSGGDPNRPPATEMLPSYSGDAAGSMPIPSHTVPMPMMPQIVGMVILPAGCLMMPGMRAPVHVPAAGPDVMGVPVERFARWPGLMPPAPE